MRNVKRELTSKEKLPSLNQGTSLLSKKKKHICLDCGKSFSLSLDSYKYPYGYLCLSCSISQREKERHYDSAHFQDYGRVFNFEN